jgi:hypothetical protein
MRCTPESSARMCLTAKAVSEERGSVSLAKGTGRESALSLACCIIRVDIAARLITHIKQVLTGASQPCALAAVRSSLRGLAQNQGYIHGSPTNSQNA